MYLHVSTGMSAHLLNFMALISECFFFYYTLNGSGIITRKFHVKLHQDSPLVCKTVKMETVGTVDNYSMLRY
jgi:hypothetical protein